MKSNKEKISNSEKNKIALLNKLHLATNNLLMARRELAERLGMSYGDNRDLYKELGYPKELMFEHYNGKYQRHDISSVVVEAYPNDSWAQQPSITEKDSQGEETEFETLWKTIVEKKMIYRYFHRLDVVSGIGQYGVMLLGFDDGKELSEPVELASNVIYMQIYSEVEAQIAEYDIDATSERFGLPVFYNIQTTFGTTQQTLRVHWTRIIHVADNLLTNEVFGIPRMKKVYNRLQDLETVSGGSAEMYWRGAFPGFGFMLDPEATLEGEDKEDMEECITNYLMGLQRYMKLQGVDIKQLSPTVVDPSSHISSYIDLIAGAVRIPKRILIGSEAGELASSQDETAWTKRIVRRRVEFCESCIIRPFIDRMILVGVFPEAEYEVVWPDPLAPSEQEKANIAQTKTSTLSSYLSSGVDTIMPFETFLVEIMGFTKDKASEISNEAEIVQGEIVQGEILKEEGNTK